jgi:hypothetical protein
MECCEYGPLEWSNTRVGSSPVYKYSTMVDVSDCDKRYSLRYRINYGRKVFKVQAPDSPQTQS